MSHRHVGIHSDGRLLKRPIEADLRRMLGGAGQILFCMHRGPSRRGMAGSHLGFEKTMSAELRRRALRRGNEHSDSEIS